MWPFNRPKPFDASRATVADIVGTTLEIHSDDCLFAESAKEKAIDAIMAAAPKSRDELIAAMVAAIRSQEIYCPHEGIDRRWEFGMAPPINPRWDGSIA